MRQFKCCLACSCPVINRLILETGRILDEKDQILYLILRLDLGPMADEIWWVPISTSSRSHSPHAGWKHVHPVDLYIWTSDALHVSSPIENPAFIIQISIARPPLGCLANALILLACVTTFPSFRSFEALNDRGIFGVYMLALELFRWTNLWHISLRCVRSFPDRPGQIHFVSYFCFHWEMWRLLEREVYLLRKCETLWVSQTATCVAPAQ